ncbi:UNVERIFIED_CONTAM: hypothetical protein Sangu_2242200 [Sesamum angustifolium]|uniref:Uncharacterized protein n=1 Tax=Sesamum angustifolium TaxID=2727405 RepID=A0AAW2L5F4_9LAMI
MMLTHLGSVRYPLDYVCEICQEIYGKGLGVKGGGDVEAAEMISLGQRWVEAFLPRSAPGRGDSPKPTTGRGDQPRPAVG